MSISERFLLPIALLGCVVCGTLRADTILGSSTPIPIVGMGDFYLEQSVFTRGYTITGGGSNGVDYLYFEIWCFSNDCDYFPGTIVEGSLGFFAGSPNGTLWVNNYYFQEFSYRLGGPGSNFVFYDPILEESATVAVLAYFEVTSFRYRTPYDGESYQGTFDVVPHAPIPEPSAFSIITLLLAVGIASRISQKRIELR